MSPEIIHPVEAEREILRRIKTTRDQVEQCLRTIFAGLPKHVAADPVSADSVITGCLTALAIGHPGMIQLHPSGSPEQGINRAAAFLSWRIAAVEALSWLIGDATLLPMGTPAALPSVRISYCHAPLGSNAAGKTGEWVFEQTAVVVPRSIRIAPSHTAVPSVEPGPRPLTSSAPSSPTSPTSGSSATTRADPPPRPKSRARARELEPAAT